MPTCSSNLIVVSFVSVFCVFFYFVFMQNTWLESTMTIRNLFPLSPIEENKIKKKEKNNINGITMKACWIFDEVYF